MATEKISDDKLASSSAAPAPAMASCRKKKNEEASFFEDVKGHINEFIHASMDEHKTCFQKKMKNLFSMSRVVAESNVETKEVESSLPLQTKLA